MLSTKHLGAYETLFKNRAHTTANGKKAVTNVWDHGTPWPEQVRNLCEISILEQIAQGRDVPDPYDSENIYHIMDHLPTLLKVFCLTFEEVHYEILDQFRTAYTNVLKLYPQLELGKQTIMVQES